MRLFLILSVVLVACGDDSNVGSLPDAPQAPGDATVTPPPVTLTVTLNGAPVAGVHTYFLNADSSVVKTVDTDATGTASATMVAGGSVTAINPFVRPPAGGPVPDDLRTFLGVKPGDHLMLFNGGTTPPDVTVTLTAPELLSANVTSYDVFTTCGSTRIPVNNVLLPLVPSDPTGTITLHGCNGSADILIVANGFAGNEQIEPLASLYNANVAVADGTDVVLTGDYSVLTDVKFEYTNLAANINEVRISHTVTTSHGVIEQFNGTTARDGTTALITFSEPPVANAVGIIDATIQTNFSQHEVIQRKAVTASNTFDLAGLLPEFGDGTFYNVTTKRVSWQEAATGVRPDLTTVTLNVVHPGQQGSGADPGTDPRQWLWHLVAPYAPGGEQTYPTLPTDVASWAPSVTDNVTVQGLGHLKVPGGYDALRGQAFSILDYSPLITTQADAVLLVSNSPNVVADVAPAPAGASAIPLAKPSSLSRR
jgi:hypothetical protein